MKAQILELTNGHTRILKTLDVYIHLSIQLLTMRTKDTQKRHMTPESDTWVLGLGLGLGSGSWVWVLGLGLGLGSGSGSWVWVWVWN